MAMEKSYVSSLRALALVMVTSGVFLSSVQIISIILYFTLQEKGWQYVPISILPRFYEVNHFPTDIIMEMVV